MNVFLSEAVKHMHGLQLLSLRGYTQLDLEHVPASVGTLQVSPAVIVSQLSHRWAFATGLQLSRRLLCVIFPDPSAKSSQVSYPQRCIHCTVLVQFKILGSLAVQHLPALYFSQAILMA